MYITPIYTVQMQNKYKQIQTCLMPIYSEDDNIIGVIGLDVSSDSMNFNKEDDISTALFDNNGNIIYHLFINYNFFYPKNLCKIF